MRVTTVVLAAVLLISCTVPKRVASAPSPPVIRQDQTAGEEAERESPEMLKLIGQMRAPVGGAIQPEKYLEAHRRSLAMPQISLSDGTPLTTASTSLNGWTNVGLNGGVAGRTRSLLIHPTNPQIMYMGSVSGGVWGSTNGGGSWTPLTDNIELAFISTMTMDPTNPSVIYAGTGEGTTNYIANNEGIRGLGILKTTDGGKTWTRQAAAPDFYYVNKIAVSSSNPQHVYAATGTGVFRSLDGGNTWNNVLAAPAVAFNASNPGCQDLAIRTDMSTDYLFAGCVGGFSMPGGIWRNADAAGTGSWTEVESLNGPVGIGLAIAPSSQSTVYALVAGTGTLTGGFYVYNNALQAVLRSTSNGDAGTWTAQDSNTSPVLLNTLLLNYPIYSCSGPNGDPQKLGFGDYNLDIAVDPSNPNTVWVAGVDLFRSDDAGVNWGIAGFQDTFGSAWIHADQHKVVFAPGYNGTTNQTLYVVNDGGVFQTNNSKAATVTGQNALCRNNDFSYTGAAIAWTPLNTNYITTQFYDGTVGFGGTYMGGTQDNGIWRGNPLQPAVNISGGDGSTSRWDSSDPSTYYLEVGSNEIFRYSAGGQNPFNIVGSLNDEMLLAYGSYVFDPSETRRIYVGRQYLWRSEDQGNTWASISPSIQYVSRIGVSPLDSQRVVAGSMTGSVYATKSALSANATSGWMVSNPRKGFISAVALSPTDPNTVFIAYSTFNSLSTDNHVYKSVDSGRSWTGIDGGGVGIPDIPVNSLVVDPQTAVIYAGSDVGVFLSTDGGASWAHDGAAFPQTIINALGIDRSSGAAYLWAFTFGRGIWRTPLGGALAGTVAASAPCTYSVSPTNVSIDVAGSLNSVSVNTQAGCAWVAQVVTGWVQLQPPGSGVGPGNVYFTVSPNTYTNSRAGGTFTVQGQTVTLAQQPGAAIAPPNDTLANAAPIGSVPYAALQAEQTYTSDASDPVHTCTGSADYQTTWWSYTATFSGYLNFVGQSYRLDTPGSGGIVLTAYKLGNVTKAGELGCFTYPRSTTFQTSAVGFVFPVQAGTTYYLEVSATTNTINGSTIALATATAPPTLTISPATAKLGVSGTAQFTAQSANLTSGQMRWSISPHTGSMDQNGNYTAPTSLTAPATVTVTAVSIANPSLSATATITISPAPVEIGAVTNAASFLTGAVAPGELVTLFGNGLGPATLTGIQLTPSGTVATSVAQTQVTFDGYPAPVIYVQGGQTTVVAPYEIAGKASAHVVATYQGQASADFTVPVAAAAPGIFALADGKQGAILNYSSSGAVLNTQQTAAPAGSLIVLYATGEGVYNPASSDGQVNNGPTLPVPVQPVSLTIGGVPAQIGYAGAAPGDVAGVLQVNATVPSGLSTGAQPLVLTVGTYVSSAYVTVWVK